MNRTNKGIKLMKKNQIGGDATALPIEWYQPCDQQCQQVKQIPVSTCGIQRGGRQQHQKGGAATNMPRVFYDPSVTDKCTSCACGTSDFIDYLYRGNCARCNAREDVRYDTVNLAALPEYGCNLPGSVQDLRLSERTASQTGGSTFGAPFANQTFGCAAGVPGVSGLSYRFNECDFVTGVNFRPLY